MLDLVRRPARELVWNRTERKFFFHYTTRAAAQAIYRARAYRVGTRPGEEKAGLYVTDVQPGELSGEELLNELFDGTRDLARTEACVVLFRDSTEVAFKKHGPRVWRARYPPGHLVTLRRTLVGWAALVEGEWLHSESLFLPEPTS